MNSEFIESHSQSSSSLLLQTNNHSYFSSEVIGKNRTQNKSWRSGMCMAAEPQFRTMHLLYTAPAFLFTRRKSHITKILINIARQMSSFGGTAAQEFIVGRGNIDALAKGWRAEINESIKTTAKAGTTMKTAEQNRTKGMQNSDHQQQTMNYTDIAPAFYSHTVSRNTNIPQRGSVVFLGYTGGCQYTSGVRTLEAKHSANSQRLLCMEVAR